MFKKLAKSFRIQNLTESFNVQGQPLSELKAAYDFLTLHLSKLEETALNNNRSLRNNKEYLEMKTMQEKLYNLMLERIKKPFWSALMDH